MEFKVEDYVEEGLILLAKLISFKTVLHQYDPKAEAPFGEENKQALKFILETDRKSVV